MKLIAKIRLLWNMWMSFLVNRELSINLLGSLTVYRELVTETLLLFLRVEKTKINGDICELARDEEK